MKKGKIFLMSLLALLVSSISLTSCGQNVDSSKNSGNSTSIIRDPDEVYVSSIEVVKPPKKTKYIPLEEAFNSEGMVIKAIWSDGYVEDNVSASKYYVEPSGVLPVGIDHVTVHYGDASNWVTNMQNWTPYQVGDIYLKDFMTVEVNGVEHSLKDDLVLHGCGDGTKGDHSYWTNWETLDLGKITLNPALEINTIKFTVAIDKGLDENGTYKYMYNNNGMYAFGQYDYVLLEDVE